MSLKTNKTRIFTLIIAAITAVLITASAIMFEQEFFKILPLYVSLSVMLFQSEAKRIAPLIGSLNSLLYAIVDFSYGLYGSALADVLFSFTMQMGTFILWTKRKDGKTTRFRSLSGLHRVLLAALLVAVYIPLLIINLHIGATVAPLDTYSLVMGCAIPVLMLFAFVEYSYLSAISSIVTIILNVLMLNATPDRLSYLFYSIYSAICCFIAVINVHKNYVRQTNESIKEKKDGAEI